MSAKFDNAHSQVLINDKPEIATAELPSGHVLVNDRTETLTARPFSNHVATEGKFEAHMNDLVSSQAALDDKPETPTARPYFFSVRMSLSTILQLGFMALCSIGLALLLIKFASRLESLGNWGYVGVAAVEFGNSAMLAIPTPSYAYTFAMGSILNPFVIGIIGGTFAMFGELIGYYLGRRGSAILPESPRVERFKSWTSRWGAVVLFWFAILPAPFDIAGIWAGAAHYPLIHFIPVVTLGKTIKITVIAVAGYFGMDALMGLAVGFGI